MKYFNAFKLYPDPYENDPLANLGLTEKRHTTHLSSLIRNNRINRSSLQKDDIRIAGMVLSALIESEFTAFLSLLKLRGMKNARNGYHKRSIKTPGGELEFIVPRDRSGKFEPALVRPYRRHGRFNIDDLLSLTVVEGYTDEERRRILENVYESNGLRSRYFPLTLSNALQQFKDWNSSPLPKHVKTIVGFSHHAENGTGIKKHILGLRALGSTGEPTGMLAVATDAGECKKAASRLFELASKHFQMKAPYSLVLPEGCLCLAAAAAACWPTSLITHSAELVY